MSTMRVSNLPVDPGPAAWNNLLAPRGPAQTVDSDQSADWLVIAARFAGLSAARRLSQLCPSDRIIVLDAKCVAEGPAGRNSGFMIDLPHDLSSTDYGGAMDHDRALIYYNRHAIEFAAQMAGDFDLGADVFDRCGKINDVSTAKGDAHNRDYAAHLAAIGETSEMLDADAMRSITGSDYYRSGLFTAGIVMIQPAAWTASHAITTAPFMRALRFCATSPCNTDGVGNCALAGIT